MKKRLLAALTGAVVAAGVTTGYAALTPSASADTTASAASVASPAIGHYYATIREAAPLKGFTLYRPVGEHLTKVPVVVWGNGGCRTSNEEFITFLTEIAAHGFAVLAVGTPQSRFHTAFKPRSAAVLLKAVRWASTTPSSSGDVRSTFDASKIAVMGQSCGGIQALAAGSDRRVKSVAAWSGSSGPSTPDTAVLAGLHTPTLWVTGGQTDPAYSPAHADYAAVPDRVPSVLVNNSAAGHVGIYHGVNDPTAAAAGAPVLDQTVEVQGSTLAVDWLDYTLNGNKRASSFFLGTSCGLCAQANWTVQSKNIPAR